MRDDYKCPFMNDDGLLNTIWAEPAFSQILNTGQPRPMQSSRFTITRVHCQHCTGNDLKLFLGQSFLFWSISWQVIIHNKRATCREKMSDNSCNCKSLQKRMQKELTLCDSLFLFFFIKILFCCLYKEYELANSEKSDH